jgi:hypothetical protein
MIKAKVCLKTFGNSIYLFAMARVAPNIGDLSMVALWHRSKSSVESFTPHSDTQRRASQLISSTPESSFSIMGGGY